MTAKVIRQREMREIGILDLYWATLSNLHNSKLFLTFGENQGRNQKVHKISKYMEAKVGKSLNKSLPRDLFCPRFTENATCV